MLEFLQYQYLENPLFHYYILSFVVILGLIFGSFINVVGLRLLSGESIVLPPSKCPKCNTKLKWYDNIPVLAYLTLGGKCRYCKTNISWQYPVVEAMNAVLYLLIFLKFEFSLATLFLWILASCSIVMCITDFREQVIFDAVSMPLIPIGLVYSFFNLGMLPEHSIDILNTNFEISNVFLSSLTATVLAFVIFEFISLCSKLIIQQRAFGEGDTIIAMIFGAFFGWQVLLLTILLSFVIQALITFPLIILKMIKLKDKIAFFSFATLLISALIPLFLLRFDIFYNSVWGFILFVSVLLLASVSALKFLKRMNELNAYTMLPFGPALIIAGFLAFWFKDYFISILGF